MKRVRSRMLHPPWRWAGIALVALIGFLCLAPVSSTELPLPAEENPISVELIQTALKSLGHYAGPLDGRLGPEMRTALGVWQESAGLEVTGELTRDQQQALIRESAAAGLAEARELLETIEPVETPAEPSPPSDNERITTLETALRGLDQRLKTAGDGIDASSQALADLGTRLDSEINTLEIALRGFDQRLKTAGDGIDTNSQTLADLGTRLDSALEKADANALRIDSLGGQLKQSSMVLEDHRSRIEANSIKLYETLMGIDSAKEDLTRMQRAYGRMQAAPAEPDAPDSAADSDSNQFGLLLTLVLCLLVPLAVVVNQGGFHSTATGAAPQVKHVAWILVAWFGGGAGFFLIGIGIMYGPSLGGVIGDPGHFFSTMMLSALADFPPGLLELLVPNLVLASIVAVVVCSSAPRGLTNRGHFLVALVAGGVIYPLFGHWNATPTGISQQSGWLTATAFACSAAATNVPLLGGILALSLAKGLGIIRSHSIASSARPVPASTGTTGAMLLWVAWIGVILTASSDCLPPSALLFSLSGTAGGAVLGVLVVDGATNRGHQWQNRLPFAVLAGVVAAPIGAQAANFIELAALGALTGVSASLLLRFVDTRWTADVRLASALLVGGIFGTLGTAIFGPTGFLFIRSIDILAPQLRVMGAALLLGLIAGQMLALPIKSTRFLRAPT